MTWLLREIRIFDLGLEGHSPFIISTFSAFRQPIFARKVHFENNFWKLMELFIGDFVAVSSKFY